MKNSNDKSIFFNGITKALITMGIMYTVLSLLRISAPVFERFMNDYRHIEFLAYGFYCFILIGACLIYWNLGVRSYRRIANLFAIPGDFFLIGICAGILLNYFSGEGFGSLGNGRIFSNLFGLTSILSMATIAFFISTFFYQACYKLYKCYKKKLSKEEKSEDAKEEIESVMTHQAISRKEQDLLNRYKFAEHIKDYILNKNDESYIIGILGQWGDGKSSLISMVITELNKVAKERKNDSSVNIIEFTPWYFGVNHHEILQKFMLQLSDEIRNKLGANRKLSKDIRQYAKLLSSVTFRPDAWNFAFKDILDVLFPSDEAKSLSSLKKEIENSLKDLENKFVIIIDDLDRLDPAEIQMVLKLVRLVADFPNIVYIIAMDEEAVANSIQVMYSQENDNDSTKGKRFLEKFIQLPLMLPKTNSGSLYGFFAKGLEEVQKNLNLSESLLNNDVIVELEGVDYSPRNIKRTLFTYEFYLQVLKNEVDKTDLLRLIIIKILDRDLYKSLYRNKKYLISQEEPSSECKKDFINKEQYKSIIIGMFPHAGKIFAGKNETKSLGERRIADPKYFERYFRNVLLDNEISQEFLKDFLLDFSKLDNLQERLHFYESSIKPYSFIDFHMEFQHKVVAIEDIALLLNIVEVMYYNYEKIHRNNNKEHDNSEFFFGYELIVKAAAKQLKKDLLNNKDFNKSNLHLWLNIFDYMSKENIGIDLENKEKLLHDRMLRITLDEMFEYDIFKAKGIFQKIKENAGTNEFIQMLHQWISDPKDLGKVLMIMKYPSISMIKEEGMEMHNTIMDLMYFPPQVVKYSIESNKRIEKKADKNFKRGAENYLFEAEQYLTHYLYNVQFVFDYVEEMVGNLLVEKENSGNKELINPNYMLENMIERMEALGWRNQQLDNIFSSYEKIIKIS